MNIAAASSTFPEHPIRSEQIFVSPLLGQFRRTGLTCILQDWLKHHREKEPPGGIMTPPGGSFCFVMSSDQSPDPILFFTQKR